MQSLCAQPIVDSKALSSVEKSSSSLLETVPLASARSASIDASAVATEKRRMASRVFGHLEHACLNLSPSFFSLNMGTGITSILLYNLPYNGYWLQNLGIVIFVINILIFGLLLMGNGIRYLRWKGLFCAVACHPSAAMFWGTLPMGFATIIVSYACGKCAENLTKAAEYGGFCLRSTIRVSMGSRCTGNVVV